MSDNISQSQAYSTIAKSFVESFLNTDLSRQIEKFCTPSFAREDKTVHATEDKTAETAKAPGAFFNFTPTKWWNDIKEKVLPKQEGSKEKGTSANTSPSESTEGKTKDVFFSINDRQIFFPVNYLEDIRRKSSEKIKSFVETHQPEIKKFADSFSIDDKSSFRNPEYQIFALKVVTLVALSLLQSPYFLSIGIALTTIQAINCIVKDDTEGFLINCGLIVAMYLGTTIFSVLAISGMVIRFAREELMVQNNTSK